jgi:superfamily II DNA or RNA helicase
MITLRPYQQTAVERILDDWNAGINSVLLTCATGGGKTAIFLSLLNQVLVDGKRGLVLAHRKELIDQPLARLYSYYPAWQDRAGVVMADTHQPNSQLVIATVQTLVAPSKGFRKDRTRLDDILYYGPIDYLVTDEAHHATAETYLGIYKTLSAANPGLKHLGVTATPMRADGDGLVSVFQKESAHFGIVELIREGYLAPVRWLAIQTKVSLQGVATRAGDFVAKQLSNVYEVDNCLDLVVESHKLYADGRQAIAFTVSVEGAYRLAEKFNAAGIRAAAADGTTAKKTRSSTLADFTNGKTQVLCNVGLYTEGLDVPQASCIHQVRPTRSDSLYIQMVGRALRPYPGKEDALILDYAPEETRNIAMMGDVLGCPIRRDAYTQQGAERGDVQAAFTFDGEFGWREGSPAEIIARQLDYLDMSPWSWYRAKDGFMSLGLGEAGGFERTLLITPPDTENTMTLYAIWRTVQDKGNGKVERGRWQYRELASGDFASLQERADEICSKWCNGTLAAKKRSWRREPPSDSQIAFARRLRAWTPGMSKGDLAQSITHSLALQAIRR